MMHHSNPRSPRYIIALVGLVCVVALICDCDDAVAADCNAFANGLGIPAGYMDWSANMRLTLPLSSGHPIRSELVFHESFSAKRSEGAWTMVNVLAGYWLLRYSFKPLDAKWVPYVAAGGGAHYILSRDGPGYAGGKTLYHYFRTKAHGFAGLEWSFKPNKFIAAQVRFTYPSDLILDAVYLNYGIRF